MFVKQNWFTKYDHICLNPCLGRRAEEGVLSRWVSREFNFFDHHAKKLLTSQTHTLEHRSSWSSFLLCGPSKFGIPDSNKATFTSVHMQAHHRGVLLPPNEMLRLINTSFILFISRKKPLQQLHELESTYRLILLPHNAAKRLQVIGKGCFQ